MEELQSSRNERRSSILSPGVIIFFVSVVFGSLMMASAKLALETNDEFIVMAGRMLVTGLPALAVLRWRMEPGWCFGPPGPVRLLLIARGFLGFLSLCTTYYAVQYMTLSDHTFLNFLTPLGTALGAHMLLGERYIWQEAAASCISLFGVVIISRPPIIFGNSGEDSIKLSAVVMQLIQVVVSVFTSLILRKIGDRAHPLAAVAQFALQTFVASLVLIVAMIPYKTVQIPSTLSQWALIGAVGLLGLIYQYLMTLAYSLEEASVLAQVSYAGIITAMLWEYLLFHHLPTPVSLIGGGIVLCGVAWSTSCRPKVEPVTDYALSEEEDAKGCD